MNKILLLSGLVAPIVISLLSVRTRHARRALRRAVVLSCLFSLAYVTALIALFGRL